MNYKISNSKLSVEISSKGGELRSIQDAEGKEYLWQGDVASWTDRGSLIFLLAFEISSVISYIFLKFFKYL